MSTENATAASAGVATGPLSGLLGPWAIAVYTYREGIRKRTLVGFLILSLLVIFGAFFMTSFLGASTTGGDADPGRRTAPTDPRRSTGDGGPSAV